MQSKLTKQSTRDKVSIPFRALTSTSTSVYMHGFRRTLTVSPSVCEKQAKARPTNCTACLCAQLHSHQVIPTKRCFARNLWTTLLIVVLSPVNQLQPCNFPIFFTTTGTGNFPRFPQFFANFPQFENCEFHRSRCPFIVMSVNFQKKRFLKFSLQWCSCFFRRCFVCFSSFAVFSILRFESVVVQTFVTTRRAIAIWFKVEQKFAY